MVLSFIQDAPQNAKVAAVVSFYMMSALVVRHLIPFLRSKRFLTLPLEMYRWCLCEYHLVFFCALGRRRLIECVS